MRRDELFQMFSLPRKRAKGGTKEHVVDTQFSYFSQIEPRKNAPSFSRLKGASLASTARRQANVKKDC